MLSFSSKIFIIILFIIGLSSCSSQRETQDDILHIKISDNETEMQLYASDFVSDIEYIALETNSQCLIGNPCNVSISENYILVYSIKEVEFLLFSRTGKFIRKIGQMGNGPEDYLNSSYVIKIEIGRASCRERV